MASIRVLAALALCAALFGCSSAGGDPTPTPSAHAGLGAPAVAPAASPAVVDEAMFQTPSKNIFCALIPSAVRCDIAQNKWNVPSKPADCDLDWGRGAYLEAGRVGFTCTGDTLLGTATETLEYGRALRSGDVLCSSESTGLTCKDEKTGRGFTMSVARYSFF
ncbi:hypothetical protein BJ973_008485 [Actinoplanes tereljensis]|uniref:Uncharacterized protein n=1 Tax=Paractinoplanes tereljensis TaxID=571912 RepID=A0A919NI92_9ACTN|nr:DUF6636 domain-containing protein [Actinoplanes tereljensis]GIF18554.1 hypothetical protein Ate02nite_12840 [Actinoplanes tereljensis]